MALRRWLIGMLCLPLLGVAGCSDDETSSDPDPTPTPSVTAPSPTASKTPDEPVEPEPPAAMAGKDAAAAEAFVRYYWEVVNYAQASGDTQRLRALNYDLCKSCASAADGIDEVYEAGGTIKGGKFSTSDVNASRLQKGDVVTFSVEFTFAVTKEVIRYSGEAKPKRKGGGRGRLRALVRRDSAGTWRVSQWDLP